MARIRTIKPELAKHEILFELEQQLGCAVRFAWAMLFTQCDREGRFKWRPRPLKLDILPYDDCDFSRVLDAWVTRGLLVKYRVGNEWFGCIPTFSGRAGRVPAARGEIRRAGGADRPDERGL